jgi:hypothetical protein
VWAIYYFSEQARRESALDLNNILFIRKNVNSGKKTATREEGCNERGDRSACEQYITLLSRSDIHLRLIRVTHCLFVKALI